MPFIMYIQEIIIIKIYIAQSSLLHTKHKSSKVENAEYQQISKNIKRIYDREANNIIKR